MFKNALSSLTDSVVGAAKNTAKSYIPTSQNLHGSFERIAYQGIANLSFRSPIMADMAEQMLKNFQIESARKEEIRAYVNDKKSNKLREGVESKLGSDASKEKIDKEMTRVLTKISRSVDSAGIAETKKTAAWKEYEKQFSKFLKDTREKKPTDTAGATGSVATGRGMTGGMSADGSAGDGSASLAKIEYNTNRTVNVLEEMVTQRNVTGGHTGATGEGGGTGASFIDPITGMPSMRAAVGSIGGSFLAKVFDDDMIDKFADKARNLIVSVGKKTPANTGPVEPSEVPTPTVTPKKSKVTPKESSSVSTVLGDLNLDLETVQKNTDTQITPDTSPVTSTLVPVTSNIETVQNTESTKESSAKITDKANEAIAISREQLAELKKLNEKSFGVKEESGGGIMDSLTDLASKGGRGKGILSKGIQLASRAAPLLGATAATAAAGFAGYEFGKHILAPGIDAGISKLTGEETSLGGWIYDKTHSKPDTAPPTKEMLVAAEKRKTDLIASKKNQGDVIQNLVEKKTAKEAETAKTPQPVIISANKSMSGGGTSGKPTVLVASSVRNQDSTFERVQMQDFWPRTA